MELPHDKQTHFFYFFRWCIQHDFSDEQILKFSKMTPDELSKFKKEVIEFFGDERGTKGSYRHIKF
jgi:hypothetical protein